MYFLHKKGDIKDELNIACDDRKRNINPKGSFVPKKERILRQQIKAMKENRRRERKSTLLINTIER